MRGKRLEWCPIDKARKMAGSIAPATQDTNPGRSFEPFRFVMESDMKHQTVKLWVELLRSPRTAITLPAVSILGRKS